MDGKLERKIEKQPEVEESLDRRLDRFFPEPSDEEMDRIFDRQLEPEQAIDREKIDLDYNIAGTKYYWKLNAEDGENFQAFREDSTSGDKRLVSQTIGESYGHEFVTDVLGYETVLDPISKFDSFPQGFDAIYRDANTGEIVIGEFKGQDAVESKGQKRIAWSANVCDRIIARQGIYAKAGDVERELAFDIRAQIDRGNVRYEMVQTRFDSQTGDIYSVVKDRRDLSANEENLP
jgi:hypothetical protein